ncbi:type II secretion system F family protein [Ammoniphilus resinae]|uniref:Type IV pilus assembly protein PilC n=1 Tax=Ammoniphilus resinae TaxID=861532 RepID=A0ABS4GSK5_9BACL|nr:type II secretion system F family protein [Ammoniphilus resinae]MBP1932830.1 type IV pilus assembly protein PilC [Ammoniphilus resinae]
MWNKNWTDQHLAEFSFNLQQLVEAGIPLLKAVQLLEKSTTNRRRKEDYRLLEKLLTEGRPLSVSLKTVGCPAFYCLVISSSELHGQLTPTLHSISRFYQKKHKRLQQYQKASTYPVIVLLTSVLTFYLLFRYLFPQFTALYQTFQIQLPWFTVHMIQWITWWNEYFAWFLLAFLFLVVFWVSFKRRNPLLFEKFRLKLPFFSTYFTLSLSSFLTVQMGLLLESGITILQICKLFSVESRSALVKHAFLTIEKELLKGSSLASACKKVQWLPEFVYEVLRISEETGTLGVSLKQIGTQLEEELDQWIEKTASRTELFMIVGNGIVILVMMLTMFLPLFGIIGQI